MEILFGFKDIGGANAVLSVADLAKARGHAALLYGEGTAYERFKGRRAIEPAAEISPVSIFEHHPPNLVVATTCSPGGASVPFHLTVEAALRGIPVVWVQDYWGNHLKHDWGEIRPHAICVQDEFAKRLVLDRWPDYDPEKIRVTGSPAFDRLASVDRPALQAQLVKELALDQDWPIFVFSGQIWGMPSAVDATIEALNFVGRPIYFLIHDHLRLLAADVPEEYRAIYAAYRDQLARLAHGRVIDSSSIKSPDLVNFGADLLLGMYTTTLVERCYLEAPSISVWTPGAAESLATETKGTLKAFPPAELGAVLQGTDARTLAEQLQKFFRGDLNEMRESQRRHYVSDGRAAERILDVVVSIAG